jgi:hypothetical protein
MVERIGECKMTQNEALAELELIIGVRYDSNSCTGHADTCPVEECMLCSVRDCPGQEPLHYHHDGCPYCYYQVEGYRETI